MIFTMETVNVNEWLWKLVDKGSRKCHFSGIFVIIPVVDIYYQNKLFILANQCKQSNE